MSQSGSSIAMLSMALFVGAALDRLVLNQTLERVECREFAVLDEGGATIAEIRQGSQGLAQLTFFDRAGKELASIGAGLDPTGSITGRLSLECSGPSLAGLYATPSACEVISANLLSKSSLTPDFFQLQRGERHSPSGDGGFQDAGEPMVSYGSVTRLWQHSVSLLDESPENPSIERDWSEVLSK